MVRILGETGVSIFTPFFERIEHLLELKILPFVRLVAGFLPLLSVPPYRSKPGAW